MNGSVATLKAPCFTILKFPKPAPGPDFMARVIIIRTAAPPVQDTGAQCMFVVNGSAPVRPLNKMPKPIKKAVKVRQPKTVKVLCKPVAQTKQPPLSSPSPGKRSAVPERNKSEDAKPVLPGRDRELTRKRLATRLKRKGEIRQDRYSKYEDIHMDDEYWDNNGHWHDPAYDPCHGLPDPYDMWDDDWDELYYGGFW